MVLASGVLGGCGGFELIETKVLAAAGTFDFLNIPQEYSDLLLVGTVRLAAAIATDSAIVRFNADAGANYDSHYTNISGAGVVAGGVALAGTSALLVGVAGGLAPASRFSPFTIRIPGYRNLVAYKAVLGEYETFSALLAASIYRGMTGAVWRSAAAITSILFYSANANPNFVAGSQLSLYGLGGP
jgi:hypothetical protein